MSRNGIQESGVIETTAITAEPKADAPPSFRTHHENLDQFVEECNRELCVNRGLHACEASVSATWRGQAVLRREAMTTVRDPKMNAPITMEIKTPLDLPWLMPKEERQSAAEIITRGLDGIEQAMREQCAKAGGVLRQSFNEFARQGDRIVTPSGLDTGR